MKIVVCPFVLLAIVFSVLRFTASDYHFGILWPLYCLSFFDLRLLITTLVSCGHCIVCPSIYGFWLPLWYLVAIVLSVLRLMASDYHFGILWPLYCLSFFDLRLLITTLVSCGHCIVCPSSIYGFWLPLWYLVAIVLSVLRFTASDYHFGILWPLYCLSFDLRLLITSLVSCGHCIVCPSIYGFWLPLWYLVAIVLSVLRFTASDYLFGILWPLYCLSFDLWLLITTLVSCGHCIVCPSIYGFWLPLWYLVAIVLSVLRFTVRLLITTLVSCGHCIVCPSIYGFWLPLWYLVAIVLSVLRFTVLITSLVSCGHCIVCPSIYGSDYLFGILWPLYCLSFDLRLLITSLVSCGHCIVCPSIYGSDYLFGILWPLYCLSFDLRLLITSLVSCGHCIVCPSIYGFWLPLWYLVAIVFSVLRFTASDYLFGILWPLYFLSFDLRLLITSLVLVSCGHCIVCPSIYGFWLPLWYLVAIVLSVLRFTASDYLFGILWPLYCLSFDLRLLITSLVSCGHCIVCPSIYGFWLPLWYLVAIVLSVLRFTASDYLFGILWPLYFLSFDLRLLITSLVSCGHCIVCPSIYGFWLPLWYLVAIVFSVLRFTASDYLFGILWPLYFLSFDLRLLITSLVSCGHCIVCPSIYGFWLPLWYLVAIVLSVLRFTASDYLFGILWPLYCLSFDLRLLITSLVSCGHCIVCPSIYGSDYLFGILWPLYCLSFDLRLLITSLVSCGHCIVCPSIYGFWLPLWYLVAIVFSVLRFTASDYLFGILWPLYCLSFDLRLLITSLVSCGHCIFCPSIYGFWLPLWYLVAIVLSVLRFTASDYLFGILWPLYCLSFDLRLLITSLVSCGHCIVCPSINGFWLPLWYLVAIVLSVLLRFTASDYHFGILWPLYCLSFFDLRLLITTLVSCGHCIVCPSIYGFWLPLWYLVAIVLSVLRFTASDYLFGILWPLYCLSFDLWLLITTLVSCGHCIVCPSIYGFWLPLWYLVAIVLSVLRFMASDYHFGILWPLYCLSFDLRLLITTLVSCGHCIVCPSIYGFWLPLWYLVAIVLSVLRFTASDYLFGILWPLYCLSFDLRLLITSLVSCGHCIVCPSIYGFWLPLWYLVAIVLSVLRFTVLITSLVSCGHCIVCPSIYGFWLPLWYLVAIVLSVLRFTVLITSLVSCGHCIVCPSIYGFWLPLWYLVAIVLSVLRFTASDYLFGILWPLYFLSFDLRLLTTSLVSCGHCIVCPSIYGFWLPLWYLVAIVLSVLRFTASDYLFGILWPLYCLSFDLRLLITSLVSCGHCIVCPSIYGFWLPLWYLVAIVLSVLRFTASDYLFGILWPLYFLSFDLRLLITSLVSCGHCIVCPSIYGFWLPLWYLVAIVFSVLRFTASDYLFGILWPLYCLSFDLRLLITSLVSCGHCIVCPSIYGSDYHFGILWPLYCLSFDLRLLITSLVSCGHCIVCPLIYGSDYLFGILNFSFSLSISYDVRFHESNFFPFVMHVVMFIYVLCIAVLTQ